MGRKQTNPVGSMFFVYSPTTDTSKCQLSNCPYPLMKGRHSKTLEKHIELRHPESYKELVKEKEKINNNSESSEEEKLTPEKRLKVRYCYFSLSIGISVLFNFLIELHKLGRYNIPT